jgi:hypothetical protein
MNQAIAPLDDTFSVRNVSDTTKIANIDASHIPSSTMRSLDAEALYRNGSPIITQYLTGGSFTHTFQPQSRFFYLEGAGGGGSGGSVDGQGAGTFGAASGGSAGFQGFTAVYAIPVDGSGDNVDGTVVVGAGAAAPAAGNNNGNDGSSTTWNDGTNSLTWPGGPGGKGCNAAASANLGGIVSVPTVVSPITGHGERGWLGSVLYGTSGGSFFPKMVSGRGGQSPNGNGGVEVVQSGTGGSAGNAGGRGSGGSGAVVVDQTNNYAGGAGGDGYLIVREW